MQNDMSTEILLKVSRWLGKITKAFVKELCDGTSQIHVENGHVSLHSQTNDISFSFRIPNANKQ